jgi:proteasome assembly chaperone (PAC2) family protein
MADDKLRIYDNPTFHKPRLVMGFSGWMDSGDVSTGTIKVLVERLGARQFAEISPQGFYIYNFPGAMDLAAMFRPHCRVQKGLLQTLEFPQNVFFHAANQDLILFAGREPNLAWEDYADCVFSLCAAFHVETIYFMGSVAGLVPHTRDPWLFCSVSHADLKPNMEHLGFRLSDYEGPASITTYLAAGARDRGIDMVNLVATVPAYVQGSNPKCIDAVVRRLIGMLGVEIHLDDLRAAADEFERRLTEAVNEQPELAESVVKLEQDYDNEVFNSEMGDLRQWLHQKGVRLD